MNKFTVRDVLYAMRELANEFDVVREGMEYYDASNRAEQKDMEDMLLTCANSEVASGLPLKSRLMIFLFCDPTSLI